MAQTVFENCEIFYIFSVYYKLTYVLLQSYVHPIGPRFGVMDSYLTLNKLTEQVFENSKILQNFGIKIESRHYVLKSVLVKNVPPLSQTCLVI